MIFALAVADAPSRTETVTSWPAGTPVAFRLTVIVPPETLTVALFALVAMLYGTVPPCAVNVKP